MLLPNDHQILKVIFLSYYTGRILERLKISTAWILRSHGIVQYFRPVQKELSKG